MEIRLIAISKLSSEVISENVISVRESHVSTLDDLYDNIHKVFPTLQEDDYWLYWLYSPTDIYPITDYFSYVAALNIPFQKNIYMLLKDYEEPWEDNIDFLENLDRKAELLKLEKERDIYDVKIYRGEPEEEEEEEVEEFIPLDPRSDLQIIIYATRSMPHIKFYTMDMAVQADLVKIFKKGWPPVKRKLVPLEEEIIQRGEIKKDKGKKKGKEKDKKKNKKGKEKKGKGKKDKNKNKKKGK